MKKQKDKHVGIPLVYDVLSTYDSHSDPGYCVYSLAGLCLSLLDVGCTSIIITLSPGAWLGLAKFDRGYFLSHD